MRQNYLREMLELGYSPENIDSFHLSSVPYLATKFFPDKETKVLDIGAGQGHCLIPLKQEGYDNLWAADIDSFNKDLFQKNSIQFFQIDIETQPFPVEDDFFGVILSFHLIEHVSDPTNFLKEAYRILKKEGILILVTPDWRKQYKVFWRDHTHVRPYDKVSIARILRCFSFEPFSVTSFGVLKGIGRSNLWRILKNLMFTGQDLIAVSKK